MGIPAVNDDGEMTEIGVVGVIKELVVPSDQAIGTPVDDEGKVFVDEEVIGLAPGGHSVDKGVSKFAVSDIGGSDEGGTIQPLDPQAHIDETIADELRNVVAGQSDIPSVQDVTTTVEVMNAVEAATRELLCLGLNTGTSIGTLMGIWLKVADEGAMGPFRRAELRMVLLGAGSNCLPATALICSSTFAQLKIWSGSAK
ncbi:MAG: hypothetical protein L6R38_005437 [Xanthoria sp. 2 TBL-2021]|nr:MAG: hypothetical protein L6R38_005437 [Xanthoria sp. 2 TBL-2021]